MVQVTTSKQTYNNSTIENIIAWCKGTIAKITSWWSKPPTQETQPYFDDSKFKEIQARSEARARIDKAKNQIYRQW